MKDNDAILLGHGAGGRLSDALIREVFLSRLGNPVLDALGDSALLQDLSGPLAMTTDGFVVSPRQFPGGDLGCIAIYGTVNDLAVAGAVPRYLTLSVILEEGMPLAELNELVGSLARAAEETGVRIVAGDTKVVGRGAGDGAYFVTTGVGELRPGVPDGLPKARPGDRILVSGPVGDHGATILALRSDLAGPGLRSDCGAVTPLVDLLFDGGILPVFLRDPTRGGLAATLNELAESRSLTVRVREDDLPVRPEVEAVCDVLGVDPLHLACEGRVVAVVPEVQAEDALAAWRAHPKGEEAALIGQLEEGPPRVLEETLLGGLRVIDRPSTHPLPRIC